MDEETLRRAAVRKRWRVIPKDRAGSESPQLD